MIPRDSSDALIADFQCRLGRLVDIECQSTPWRSATFAGERHAIAFTVPGETGCALQNFVQTVGELEIALRKGFVADVAVVDRVSDADGTRVRIEALTIDEG